MCLVFRKNRFGDYVLTREARLAPGATILVYRDKATVQVYSRRSITGPSKVCVLQVLTKTLQLTKLYQKSSGTSHERVVSELLTNFKSVGLPVAFFTSMISKISISHVSYKMRKMLQSNALIYCNPSLTLHEIGSCVDQS